ncbi:uncharacterized protein EV422DRAFT_535905 [Fimicolochytrium jonesii]|uniref:uncharacterized protein n=1 Tax=Fimicolochytrium jonesii TaxID=1396493 RepID=UPI0022FF2CA7|nr:uncharacterized protein EV422DRAFT_535905 [Fimicolochytrium jonesii]KAI8818919.1 hypothetical protein EV422DRAFT_535905 [Fimicolochytrium jonesii]
MFRKPFATKTESQLRSSDRRKLRAELLAAYPASTEERIAELFGDGGGADVTSVKFTAHSGEQGILISIKGQPILWKDLDGNLFPTVYALWTVPNMLPSIMTHGPVLHKLFDGADLMLPGVIIPAEGFGDLQYGDIVSITVRGSLMPMAVGTMAISSDEIKKSNYAMRGKGVHILHTFGDTLWASGDKSTPPDPVDEADTSGSWSEISYPHSGMSTPVNVDVVTDSVRSLSMSVPDDEATQPNHTEAADEDDTSSIPQLTPAEMDTLLSTALLTALKTLPTDSKTLPMPSSILYANHIMPSRPRGTHLDIKQSSYKKVGKFLKAMEKRGLIKLKERGGETLLVGVNGVHPLLKEFEAPRKIARDEKKKDSQTTSTGTGPAPGSSNGTNPAPPSINQIISITEFFKPSQKELRFFEEVGGSKNDVYSAADIRTAVTEYISAKGLVDDVNPRMVKIDPTLCDTILQKHEYTTIDYLPRDEIVSRLRNQMPQFHQLNLPASPQGSVTELRKGPLKPLQITTEQRQGRKMVTKVVGLERFGVDPETFAGVLRGVCASSTSLSPLPGKANAHPTYEVMVQGNKVKEVCGVLEREYGVPFSGGRSRFVEVFEKGGKK